MVAEESDDEWRFSVDEFDDPADDESPTARDPVHGDRSDGDGDADEEEEGNVAGEFAPRVPVVPELPDAENAAFVVLGAIVTTLALASVVGGPAFGLLDAGLIAVVVGVIGAVTYGILRRLTPEA